MTALQVVQKFYPQVTTVTDATKSIIVEVTKRDTQTKAVKNHKECALAVACKRALHANAAIICVKTSYLIRGTKAIRYMNPESVSREITSFDRNAGFEPGIYSLSSVPPTLRIGTHRKNSGKHNPAGKKPSYHRTENIRVIE